jgi:plastocyanin
MGHVQQQEGGPEVDRLEGEIGCDRGGSTGKAGSDLRLRGRYLALAAGMGVFVALLTTVASSETSPTVDAVNAGLYSHYWSPAQATVGAGGSVTLRNATTVAHGVEWVGGPAKPECGSGVPVGTTPAASGTEWSGTCSFAQPGTYTFYCTVHGPEMTGTVTVSANGTTTTTTATTTPTPTTPTTSTPTGPVEPLPGSPLLRGPSLASRQRGGAVRGSLAISQAGEGDRLQVDLFATSAALGKARHRRRVRVGRLVRSSVSAGNVSFLVRLDAEARRALKRHRRLALIVRITLTPAHGTQASVTRTVIEHA